MFLFKRLFSTTTKYSPIEQLESIHKLSLAVNGTSSTIEKQALLKQFPASHSTLKRIYDPHLRHFVSSKSITTYLQKHPEIDQRLLFNNLDELLDALSSRTVTGHAACDAVASFYAAYCKTEAHKNIFWRIIDRNLKMGVSVRTIRHLTSENSPSAASKQYNHNKSSNISVALASPYSSTVKNPFNISDGWYASQKLDGIRCITMIQASTNNNYDIQFYSRTGRPFTSLQKVKLEIEKRLQNQAAVLGEFVLDGEICAYNDDTKNEDFFKALSQVRRINEEMENPIYQVFDFITLQSFLEAKGDEKFVIRQKQLKKFIGKDPLPHIKLIEQKKLTSMDQLDLMKEQAIVKGWEGLILRKNVAYEGKRTRNMLKVKEWEDAEYTVKSIETGLMRMPDTGQDKLVLTNVNIEHMGNTVSVGSGFSMHSRIQYAQDPSLIIGKPITVRYFSESKKENGTISLRFPTVKAIYDEGIRDL